jgi:squalene-hopene/tetraprenyl-beta-curcumene cyclase
MKQTLALLIFAASLTALAADDSTASSSVWNRKAAGAYLDQRQAWWITWPTAARDHGSFCISCHTALPYALARPALRSALKELEPSTNEKKMLADITNRVRLWDEVEPFYPDATRGVPKTAESRGTEAILNAMILVTNDPKLQSADTRKAFDNLWKLQQSNGAWNWLNFHNAPWEADDSQYWGTSVAAIAIASTPAEYRSTPEVKQSMASLRAYLQNGWKNESLMNRAFTLWASTNWTGLLDRTQQDAFITELKTKQQPDGGWSTSSLVGDWKRHDNTLQETRSDGYATAVATYILELAQREPQVAAKGRAWLLANQSTEGSWPATSLNKKRDPTSDAGRFMSDAATAYAVLALSYRGE